MKMTLNDRCVGKVGVADGQSLDSWETMTHEGLPVILNDFLLF